MCIELILVVYACMYTVKYAYKSNTCTLALTQVVQLQQSVHSSLATQIKLLSASLHGWYQCIDLLVY